METGAQYAGDFEITELQMTLLDGGVVLNVDKDFILMEINIFESLFSHSITGSIIVADTREVISKGAFVGQETLTLKIQTPSPSSVRQMNSRTVVGSWVSAKKCCTPWRWTQREIL